LAVADYEDVDEWRQDLRVLSAGAAGDDERMVERAILAVQWNAAQVEHGEDIGVTNLVLQAEADQVEIAQWRERLQAAQRQAMAAQLPFEIEPGGKGPLARPLRIVVHDAVEHLQAVVAHAERVGVRKGQAEL